MDDTTWDTMIRVTTTHRIFEDGLPPMEALAYALREDLGCSYPGMEDIMSSMTGRRVTGYAVKKYLTAAEAELEEKHQDRTSDARSFRTPSGHL